MSQGKYLINLFHCFSSYGGLKWIHFQEFPVFEEQKELKTAAMGLSWPTPVSSVIIYGL